MRHYSMEKWVDFARGVIEEQERTAMLSHLENGCHECSAALSLWHRVHTVGQREQTYEPPESAVRALRGAFALHGPRKVRRAVQAGASLLFDSLRTPLAEGLRSGAPNARQLLYGVGNYRVDLRLEPQPESDRLALFGQVLNSADPGAEIGASLVRLVKGRKVVAESTTNRFGEFHLESDTLDRFQLRLQLPAEELRLPAIEPSFEFSENGSQDTDSKALRGRVKRPKKRTRRNV
jgi:hypothetical protein